MATGFAIIKTLDTPYMASNKESLFQNSFEFIALISMFL